MSQKSSGMQLPQFVPKALTSDIVLETGIRGVAHAFSKCDRVVSYTTLWDTTYRHCPMFTVTPMTATCRVPPLSRVKLGIGWSRGVARDAEQ